MPFAVLKQTDVSESSRRWAEWDDGCAAPIVHRTKVGAERAMRHMVPQGEDPWTYAGLLVRQVRTSSYHLEVE